MPRTRRVSFAAALGALAVTITACGDSTGPGRSVAIAVSVTQLGTPSITPEAMGQARIACAVDFRAVARGAGAATWLDATIHWYAGKDRLPFDSLVVPAAEIQASWGEPDIDAGETLESPGWEFSAGVPFSVTVDYRYQPEGGRAAKTASVSFSCGPVVPPGTPPPTVSALTVSAPPGDFEPGDTLDVEYAAASPVGLWQTAVLLTGPCEVHELFNEELAPTVTRVVRIRIPAECRLGVPIGVTVYAFDAALQEGRGQLAPQLSLVDKTPPVVFSLFNSLETLAGDYFVGDSIPVFVGVADNHALSAIVWEVLPSGGRDSLLVTGPARVGPGLVWVHLRPEWVGQVQLRFYARDAVGLVSAPLTTANALGVYPTVERPIASASVPGEIRDFAIDVRRGAIYLLQSNERRLAIVSTATLQVTATIPTPGTPTGFDLTPGGDSLIVALPSSKALGVLDLRQASPQLMLLPLTTLDATLGQRPWYVRVLANGKAFVVLSGSTPDASRLLEVDLATGAERLRPDAGRDGNTSEGFLERSHDGTTLTGNWSGCLQRYHLVGDSFGTCQTARVGDWPPSVDAAGEHIALGTDVYDGSLQFLRRVHTTISENSIAPTALSVDGEYLYLALSKWVLRSRVSDGALLDRFPIPLQPTFVRASPDGAVLVTVENHFGATSTISTIDLR